MTPYPSDESPTSDIDIDAIGEELPLLEGLRTARAIRRLKPDPVPRSLIRKVCEAGTFAPSGGNRQPWMFVAVDDAEKRRWIADRYRPIFQKYIGPAIERGERENFAPRLLRNMRASLYLAEHLHEAPVHLFIAGFTRRNEAQLQVIYDVLGLRPLGQRAAYKSTRDPRPRALNKSLLLFRQ